MVPGILLIRGECAKRMAGRNRPASGDGLVGSSSASERLCARTVYRYSVLARLVRASPAGVPLRLFERAGLRWQFYQQGQSGTDASFLRRAAGHRQPLAGQLKFHHYPDGEFLTTVQISALAFRNTIGENCLLIFSGGPA